MKKKKVNLKKIICNVFLCILLVAFIIIIITFIKSNSSFENKNDEIAISNDAQIVENTNSIEENTVKVVDKNHLSDTEASFGELDVPVYMKDERNLRIPLLIYHGFETPELEDDVYNLFCTEDRFEEQVTALLDEGYTFLTLEDIYKYDKGYIGLPEKNITITMDDGWYGVYSEAFEVLKKYNIPATVFIVEELMEEPAYFSWEEAKEMYDTGLVKIHVHGRRHVEATGYSKEKLIEDYNHTHEKIEEVFGDKVQKIMAYPSGKCSENTIEWLKEAGFEVQVQTKYGTVNKTQTLDLTGLGRLRAEKASAKRIVDAVSY